MKRRKISALCRQMLPFCSRNCCRTTSTRDRQGQIINKNSSTARRNFCERPAKAIIGVEPHGGVIITWQFGLRQNYDAFNISSWRLRSVTIFAVVSIAILSLVKSSPILIGLVTLPFSIRPQGTPLAATASATDIIQAR